MYNTYTYIYIYIYIKRPRTRQQGLAASQLGAWGTGTRWVAGGTTGDAAGGGGGGAVGMLHQRPRSQVNPCFISVLEAR
jgi:hypothetical protein